MNRASHHFAFIFVAVLNLSCSTTKMNHGNNAASSKSCKSSDCEIQKYEQILKVIGIAETDLKDGNSFKALRNLESIKDQAYYHGRFKSLYQLAMESCLKSTNELSEKKNSCSLVRERVSFIKTVSPDKLSNISTAISNCSVDISKNAQNFSVERLGKGIELTDEEIKASNVYEEAVKIQQRYNSNPWEELLLVDLKMLSRYEIALGKPVIQKETQIGSIRFKIPLHVKTTGNLAYCSQYKELIHDEDLSGSINCYDYQGLSDQMTNVFNFESTKPQRWTEGSFITTLRISNASKQYIRELPFTKNYKKGLLFNIHYGSGKVIPISPTLSFPGELIHNLMGRLAWMARGGDSIRPHVPEIYIAGNTPSGVNFKIIKRNSSVTDFWGGYELDIILPIDMAKDLESIKISVPVQNMWEFYHNLAAKEEPISGAVYGE